MDKRLIDMSYGRVVTLEQNQLEQRCNSLRRLMHEKNLKLIFVAEPDDGGYRGWLTGSYKLDRFSEGGILVFDGHPPVIVTGSRGAVQGEQWESGCRSYSFPYRYFETEYFDGAFIKKILNGNNRIGVVHLKQMRTDIFDYFMEVLPGVKFIDLSLEADELKSHKNGEDIRVMEALANQMDGIFAFAETLIQVGISEREIVNELRNKAYELGCYGNDDGISSRIQLYSGNALEKEKKNERLLYPGRMIRSGDQVDLTVYCVGLDSCYGAMSGSYFVGKAEWELPKRLWDISVHAQEAAAKQLKPGNTIKQAAEAANEVLRKNGCRSDERCFISGIGYGMRERPFLSDRSQNWILQENTTVYVAPKAGLPGGRGVCCGNMYAVTGTGGRKMNQHLVKRNL